MVRQKLLTLVFAYAVSCGGEVYAQDQPMSLRSMTQKLAVREDLRYTLYQEIYEALVRLDSAERCAVLDKLGEQKRSNKRFHTRLLFFKFTFAEGGSACPGWGEAKAFLNEGLRLAYELDDTLLIVAGNQYMVQHYVRLRDYGSAGTYGLIAREMQEKFGIEKFWSLAGARYDLGYVLYHSREYEASIDMTRDAIFWNQKPGVEPGDSIGRYYTMIAWNTIGLCYDKLGQYDSAFVAFDKARVLSRQMNYTFWTALIDGNRGEVFFKLGQYDTAAVLLNRDYLESLASGQLSNAGTSLLLLAQINALEGSAELATGQVHEAGRLFGPNPSPEFLARYWFTNMRVFKALGNIDSLDYSMQQYLDFNGRIEQEAAHTRADIVQLRINSQDAIYRMILLQKEKERIVMIRNFSLLLILITGMLGLVYANRRRLKMQLKQKEILEAKEKAEAEVKSASEKLESFTQKVLEKTSLVEQLQEQLLHKELNEEQVQHISALSRHMILTDEDWDQFKELFEKVYPGFLSRLRMEVPDITMAEQRMAALSKLRITPKEAATLLGISPASVRKARSRLRQRLNLDPEADLELYFSEEW